MRMRCVGGPCHGQVVEVDTRVGVVRIVQVMESLPRVPEDFDASFNTATAHTYILQRITWRDCISATDRYVHLLHYENTDPVRALGDAIALLAEQEDYE